VISAVWFDENGSLQGAKVADKQPASLPCRAAWATHSAMSL